MQRIYPNIKISENNMSDLTFNDKKKQSSSDPNNTYHSKTVDAIVTNNNRNKAGMIIHEPTEVDVLCGRGGMSNHHPGNEWYRRLIKSNRPLYRACPKHTKLLVAKAIVQAVEQQTGRFLERSKKNGYWYVVTYKRAVDKTSQGLRERERFGDKDSSNDNDDSGKNSSTTTTCSDGYSDSGSSNTNTKKKSKINTRTTKTKKKRSDENDNNDDDDDDDCHNVSSEDDDEEEEEEYEGEIPEGFRSSSSIRPPDLVELAGVAISNEKNRYNRKQQHKINSINNSKKMEKVTKMNIETSKSVRCNKEQQQQQQQQQPPTVKNGTVARKKNPLPEASKDFERFCNNDNDANGAQIDYDNKHNYQKRMKMSVHDYPVDNLTNRRINNNTVTHDRRQPQQQQYRNNDFDNINVIDRDNVFKNNHSVNNRINNIDNYMQQYHLPELQANESTASSLMPLPPSMEIQESNMLRLLLHTKLLPSASTATTTTTTGPADTGVGNLRGWSNMTNVNGDGINYLKTKNDTESFSNMFNASAVNFLRRTATRGQPGFNNTHSTEQQRLHNSTTNNYFVDNNDYPFNNMNHHPESYEQMHSCQSRLLDLLLQEKLRREQLRNTQQQQQQQQQRIRLLEEPVLDVDEENCQQQPDNTNSGNKASINNNLDETPPPSTTLSRLKSQVSDWLRNSFWPVPQPGLDDAQISSLVQNQQQKQQQEQKRQELPMQHDDDTTNSKRCMSENDNSERQKRMKFDVKHGKSVKASSNAVVAPFSRQDVLQRVLASIPPPLPEHGGSRGVNTENKQKPMKPLAYAKEKDIAEDLSSIPLLFPHSLKEPTSSSGSDYRINNNSIMQHARGRPSRKSLIDDDDDDDDITAAKNDENNSLNNVQKNQQSSIRNNIHARANYKMLYHSQKEVEKEQKQIRSEENHGRSSPCLPTFDERKISLTLPSLPEFAPTESTYSLFNGLLDPFDGVVRHTKSSTDDDDNDDDTDNRHFTDLVTNGAMRDVDKNRVYNMIEGAKSLRLLRGSVSKNVETVEKESDNCVKGVAAGSPGSSQTAEEYDVAPLEEVERAVSASLLQLATATPSILLSGLTS